MGRRCHRCDPARLRVVRIEDNARPQRLWDVSEHVKAGDDYVRLSAVEPAAKRADGFSVREEVPVNGPPRSDVEEQPRPVPDAPPIERHDLDVDAQAS